MFNVGKVVNTHGIHGEIRVIKITDFEERFEPGNQLYFKSPNGEAEGPFKITAHRKHKNFDLIKFEGLENINDVERFKGGMLMISEEQQEELEAGEYYYHEIIGSSVFTLEGEEIGKVKEILSPGANDVWVIVRKGKKDLLIPYIESVVKSVDPSNKSISIEPLEGMLDE